MEFTDQIALGDHLTKVRKLLGEPDRSGGEELGRSFESFFQRGVVITYDGGLVSSINGTYLLDGTFQEQICGVALGDSIRRCTKLWGSWYLKKETGFEFVMLYFKSASNFIEIELWNEDGKSPEFGQWIGGTVKCIKLCGYDPALDAGH